MADKIEPRWRNSSFELNVTWPVTLAENASPARRERDGVGLYYGFRIPEGEKGLSHYGMGVIFRADEAFRHCSVEDELSFIDRKGPVGGWTLFGRAGLRSPFGSRYWMAGLGTRAFANPYPRSFPALQLFLSALFQFERGASRLRIETGIAFDIPLE